MQRHMFILVKRLVQLQFVEIKLTGYKFPEIKWNRENIVRLEERKCQDITHVKGVLQFR